MKKGVIAVLCVLSACLIVIVVLFFWLQRPVEQEGLSPSPMAAVSVDTANRQLTDMAYEVAGYLKAGDFTSLAAVVHPDRGVVFSPYATLDLASCRHFTREETASLAGDETAYIWGFETESNQPIEMTVSEYFDRYVRDSDYTAASLVGVNYTVRTGNALENITAVFPDAQFVDLCDPGSGDTAEAPDWSILRLVFEEDDGTFYLTAIVHSEYTA